MASVPGAAPIPRLAPKEADLPAEDRAFVEALRGAGLVPDLAGAELARSAGLVRADADDVTRHIDLLEAHYAAGGDAKVSLARRQVDRFFLQRSDQAVTASQLVARLAALAPEVGKIELERIGGSPDGPLVLRAGEHMAALLDEHEEALETGEVDLRELEKAGGPTMVTLRGLVHAVNLLLDRHGVRERLVPLHCDDDREVYLATPLTEAIELVRAGYLGEESAEDVMELCGW